MRTINSVEHTYPYSRVRDDFALYNDVSTQIFNNPCFVSFIYFCFLFFFLYSVLSLYCVLSEWSLIPCERETNFLLLFRTGQYTSPHWYNTTLFFNVSAFIMGTDDGRCSCSCSCRYCIRGHHTRTWHAYGAIARAHNARDMESLITSALRRWHVLCTFPKMKIRKM